MNRLIQMPCILQFLCQLNRILCRYGNVDHKTTSHRNEGYSELVHCEASVYKTFYLCIHRHVSVALKQPIFSRRFITCWRLVSQPETQTKLRKERQKRTH